MNPINAPNYDKVEFRQRTWQTILAKLGLEMFAVVSGVLIALFVDNARDNERDRALLKSTLLSLSNEFNENAVSIRKNLPRQSQFLDTLRYYRSQDHQLGKDYSMYDLLSKTNGYGMVDIYTTNWQANLNSNNLRFLDAQTIALLSRIDAQHQAFKEKGRFISETLFGPPLFEGGKEGMAYRMSVELWLNDYIYKERALLELYQRFEKKARQK